MMKLSKKILIVSLTCFSIIFAMALMFYSNSKSVNVVAAENNEYTESQLQDVLGTCGHSNYFAKDKDGKELLDDANNKIDNSMPMLKDGYFKFDLVELTDSDSNYSEYCDGYSGWTCTKISVENGSFVFGSNPKVLDFSNPPQEKYFFNFYNYYFVGGGNVLDKEHPLIVRFNPAHSDFVAFAENDHMNATINFEFILNEDISNNKGYGCTAWNTVQLLKAHEDQDDFATLAAGHPQTSKEIDGHKYSSFGTDISIEVMTGSNDDELKEENPYYNTYCADFRNGTSSSFGDDSGFAKYWRAEYMDEYNKYMGDVCDPMVLGILDNEEIKKFIEQIVVSTWVNKNAADASKYPIDEEFKDYKDKFEEYKKLAIAAGHKFDSVNAGKLEFNEACDAVPVSASDFNSKFNSYITDPVTKLPVYNISANKDYYYASKTESTAINFTKTYTSGDKEPINLGECSQTCEEVVVVEYGPPIASTGGVCFEYQVQVTSKVQCNTTNTLKPLPKLTLCTPRPYCNSSSTFWSQAGPNEEYDQCINSCDGGKYTEKCSESCYKKVYEGSNQDKLKKNSYNFNDVIASKVWLSYPTFDGYYKYEGNKIVWEGSGYGRFYSTGYQRDCLEGRYWCAIGNHGPSSGTYGGYYYPVSGFKWHFTNASGGGACTNYCSWGYCGRNTYLNETERKHDEEEILKLYNKASTICAAKASCTEKTATFKISVDYEYYTNEELDKAKQDETYIPKPTKTTMEFPYSTKQEDLVSTAGSNCTGPASDLEYNPNHIILNYAGCYKNCGDDTLYHTRWSFPGGWENTKTGELSWDDKSGQQYWEVLPDKFCIPSSTLNTNEKFWRYYINNLPDDQVPSWAEFVKRKKVDTNYTAKDAQDIQYNIHASVDNFGYFGWDFNFKCFYASYSQGIDKLTPQSSFRTVDLVDLFPNSDGTSKAPDQFSISDNKIPFNWSSRAVQKNGEEANLISDPVSYGKYVQTKGYDIYSDDELEYHFHLTPSTMKSFNKSGYNPTDDSESVNHQGIQAYVSKLIRSGLLKDATVRAPSTGVLGCINIKDVQDGTKTGRCIPISELK